MFTNNQIINKYREFFKALIGSVLVVSMLVILFPFPEIALGTTYSFSQTSWSGGVSVTTAIHPTDQSTWTKYSSTTSVAAGSTLTLSSGSYTTTDSTTLTSASGATGGGFSNGALSNTALSNNLVQLSLSSPSATWLSLTDVPVAAGNGATSMYPGSGDYVYVFPGAGLTSFYRHSISGNSWTQLANAPSAVGAGSSLVYPGTGDYIYAFKGGATTFWRYSISGDSWTSMASIPGANTTGNGAGLASAGGDYIYAIRGNTSSDFYRYSIAGNSWTAMASSSVTFSITGGALTYPGTGDYLYSVNSGTGGIQRYSISGNSWTGLSSLGISVSVGTVTSYGDYVYFLTTSNLYRYSISGNSWGKLGGYPVNSTPSMSFASTTNSIYTVIGGGTGFVKYVLNNDTGWVVKSTVPLSVSSGGTLVYPGSGDYIYATRGNTTSVFYRYTISNNSWTQMTNLPANIGLGGSLVYPGSGDYIYATRGNTTSDFFRYSISNNSWTNMASTTAIIGPGGSLAYPGSGDYIYALRGNTSTDFYRYSISGNNWSSMSVVPGGVGLGGSLAYPGSGDYLYALRGNNLSDVYKYSISGNSWSSVASAPFTISNGGTLMYPGSGDYMYAFRGASLGAVEFYRYSVQGNTWSIMPTSPINLSSGAALTAAGNNIYAIFGNSTTAFYSFPLPYVSSGTFTSAVVDFGSTPSFGTVTASSTIPSNTSLGIEVRAGTTATPDGSWTSWGSISNGGSISSYNGNRYMQYRLTLGATDTTQTPQIGNVALTTTQYPASASLISSAYDTTDASTVLGRLTWSENSSLPAGTSVTISLRTASSSSALTSASWTDFTNGTTNCSKVSGNVTCTAAAIPSAMKDGTGDQWVQYKVGLTSTGTNAPAVSAVGFQYVVNSAPQFDATFNTTGVQAAQVSTNSDPNFGKVTISYKVKDADTLSDTNNPGALTPSFEYNTGTGWTAITSGYLAAGDVTNQSVDSSSYTTHTATWNAAAQIPGVYNTNVQIRVTVNDNEGANNTASAVTTFTLDTKSPVITSTSLDVSNQTYSLRLQDDTNISYVLSNRSDFAADGSNAISGNVQTVGATSASTSVSWVSDPTYTTYIKAIDSFGNTSYATTSAPVTISNFDLKDTSNINTNDYRLFLSWGIYNTSISSPFAAYELQRSTDGTTYTPVTTITNVGTNYYIDTQVASSTMYYYRVRVMDTNHNYSQYSSTVSDIANGEGGTDFTPPVISAVTVSSVQATWAKITWTTDELSNSELDYSASPSHAYGSHATSSSLVLTHETTLTNLTPNTTYYFKLKSADLFNNSVVDDNGGAGFNFTTSQGTVISNVTTESVNDTSAKIFWNTSTNADSHVTYGRSISDLISGSNVTEIGDTSLVGSSTDASSFQHRIILSSLSSRTTYYYYVKSTDAQNNQAIDNNGGSYYSFTTTYDTKAPVISNIVTPVISSNTAVVVWQTDEPSYGSVEWGTTDGVYTQQSAVETVGTMSHVATLSSLQPTTGYHYRVLSTDIAGNLGTSTDQTFTTTNTGDVISITYVTRSNSDNVIDTTPPVISNVSATSSTAFTGTVTFTTDEPTMGFVYYGADTSYGLVSASADFATSHKIVIPGLKMGTQYHFMVKVTDHSGNSSNTPDATLTTKFISEALSDMVTVDNAAQFQDQLENLIQSVLPSLSRPFITDVTVASTTESSALIHWRTNVPTYGSVKYSLFSTTKTGEYQLETNQSDIKAALHDVTLQNLSAGTSYRFQVQASSLPGVISTSTELTFATKSSRIKPEISKVETSSIEVRWSTPNPSSSVVEYRNTKTGVKSQVEDPQQLTTHSIKLDHLDPSTTYDIKTFGYDTNNTLIEGNSISVRTTQDKTPPILSPLRIDNALVPGRTDRLQSVISWKTDEPSTGRVNYQEGAGSGTSLSNHVEENTLTTDHILIISTLKPATVYRLQIQSADEAGNIATSSVKTILTPHSAENVLDVIIKNLEDSFGFLNKLQ